MFFCAVIMFLDGLPGQTASFFDVCLTTCIQRLEGYAPSFALAPFSLTSAYLYPTLFRFDTMSLHVSVRTFTPGPGPLGLQLVHWLCRMARSPRATR